MSRTLTLYADGGQLSANPSPHGGTWAWLLVADERTVIAKDSGYLFPEEIGQNVVTNNNTELWALLEGLSVMPEEFRGLVRSDSANALRWLFGEKGPNAVPPVIRKRLIGYHRTGRLAHCRYENLAGHPTAACLAAGRRTFKLPALPVSCWNVQCHMECERLKATWKRGLK